MYIVQVQVHVKSDQIEAFIKETIENARNSTKSEPGVIRFDAMQQAEDPTRYVLIEVYRTQDDAAKHKMTSHYNHWREIAEPMMAESRTRVIYKNIFPSDLDYS